MRQFFSLVVVLFLNISLFASEEVSVKVIHNMGNGMIGSGSGTVIHSEKEKSVILTNKHVAPVNGSYEILVNQKRRIQAYWIGVYDNNDLALIYVKEELPVAQIATEPPNPNDRVTLFGYPGGGPLMKKAGKFVGRLGGWRGDDGGRVLKIGIEPQSGDSGGGIFTDDGVLVAVIWGTGGSAVPLKDILDFVSRHVTLNYDYPPGYEEVYIRVMSGKRTVLNVKKSIPGWPAGIYDCWLDDDGTPRMEKK